MTGFAWEVSNAGPSLRRRSYDPVSAAYAQELREKLESAASALTMNLAHHRSW